MERMKISEFMKCVWCVFWCILRVLVTVAHGSGSSMSYRLIRHMTITDPAFASATIVLMVLSEASFKQSVHAQLVHRHRQTLTRPKDSITVWQQHMLAPAR